MTLCERFRNWREARHIRCMERQLESLRCDVERANLKINKIIRAKAALEITQSRRETC